MDRHINATFQVDDDVETASDDAFEQLVRDVEEPEEPPEPDGSAPSATAAPASASGSAETSAHPTTAMSPAEEPSNPTTAQAEQQEITPEVSPATEDTSSPVEAPPAVVPEHQKRLYEATAGESFRRQTARIDKQETLSFLTKPSSYGKSETSRTTPNDHVSAHKT